MNSGSLKIHDKNFVRIYILQEIILKNHNVVEKIYKNSELLKTLDFEVGNILKLLVLFYLKLCFLEFGGQEFGITEKNLDVYHDVVENWVKSAIKILKKPRCGI